MLAANIPENSVAVVGMSGRFPGARSTDELWRNLCEGKESITRFSAAELDASIPEVELNDPDYVPTRGILEDAYLFDASFFGISPLEALLMDPQQRVFLETCWTALEDAGCAPSKYDGMIGVFAGMANNTYFQTSVQPNPELVRRFGPFQTMLANEKDFLATRVSHKLNLTGPSISMYTGCSTSLVAIASAFHNLLSYQCDVALAGGVCITCPQNSGYTHKEGGIEAVDGHCRPFDARASGTIFSNGVAIVVLKRLEEAIQDGDYIHAVVRGAATNNDGAAKVSFAAPSVQGQAEVITMAQGQADVDPATISFIEAHGTATLLGDPIEFEGLKQAFRYPASGRNHCALGSVKGNFGHLLAAAGVTGFIKAVLALEHKSLPPTINHDRINPQIDIANSPFFINRETIKLQSKDTPLRAGVSSFGIGGTNAHVILEAAPELNGLAADVADQRPHVLVVSSKTEEALSDYVNAVETKMKASSETNFGPASFTLATGREEFEFRTFVVARDPRECAEKLIKSSAVRTPGGGESDVVYLLPGLGTEYPHLGAGVFDANPVFRDQILKVLEVFNNLTGAALTAESFLQKGDQFSLFATEYALANFLIKAGPAPRALVGYSTGELVAAVLANVMSITDAMRLMVAREKILHELSPEGAMLAVGLSAEDVAKELPVDLYLAGDHSPRMSVVGGAIPAVDRFEMELQQRGVNSMRLPMRTALHTPLADIEREGLMQVCRTLVLAKPKIPMVSTLTGHWMNPAQVTDPEYWATHHCKPVLFRSALQKAAEAGKAVFVEIGPGNSLTTALHQTIARDLTLGAIQTLPIEWLDADYETEFFLEAIGNMWARGMRIEWSMFWNDAEKRTVKMPTHPFARTSYWLDAKARAIG